LVQGICCQTSYTFVTKPKSDIMRCSFLATVLLFSRVHAEVCEQDAEAVQAVEEEFAINMRTQLLQTRSEEQPGSLLNLIRSSDNQTGTPHPGFRYISIEDFETRDPAETKVQVGEVVFYLDGKSVNMNSLTPKPTASTPGDMIDPNNGPEKAFDYDISTAWVGSKFDSLALDVKGFVTPSEIAMFVGPDEPSRDPISFSVYGRHKPAGPKTLLVTVAKQMYCQTVDCGPAEPDLCSPIACGPSDRIGKWKVR